MNIKYTLFIYLIFSNIFSVNQESPLIGHYSDTYPCTWNIFIKQIQYDLIKDLVPFEISIDKTKPIFCFLKIDSNLNVLDNTEIKQPYNICFHPCFFKLIKETNINKNILMGLFEASYKSQKIESYITTEDIKFNNATPLSVHVHPSGDMACMSPNNARFNIGSIPSAFWSFAFYEKSIITLHIIVPKSFIEPYSTTLDSIILELKKDSKHASLVDLLTKIGTENGLLEKILQKKEVKKKTIKEIYEDSIEQLKNKIFEIREEIKKIKPAESFKLKLLKLLEFSNQFILMIIHYGKSQ